MPQHHEYSNTPYSLAQKKPAPLPPSHGESVTPDFLLHHENHMDRNTVTPEQLIDKGVLKGKPDPIKVA
jgi:hypothetical protein